MGEILQHQFHSLLSKGFNQIFRKLPTEPKNRVSDLASRPSCCSLNATCHKKSGGNFPAKMWTFRPAHEAISFRKRRILYHTTISDATDYQKIDIPTRRSTRPKRGGGYGCSPPHHAGNLSLHPLTGKTRRIIRNPPAHCKQRGNKTKSQK